MPNVLKDGEALLICIARVAALKKHLDPNDSIFLDGVAFHPADLIALYQGWIDRRRDVNAKRSAYQQAVVDRRRDDARRVAMEQQFRAWILGRFGSKSAITASFRVPAPKTGKRSAEVRANAVEKGKATRAARHTMGKKQKQKIRGEVAAAPTPTHPPKGTKK